MPKYDHRSTSLADSTTYYKSALQLLTEMKTKIGLLTSVNRLDFQATSHPVMTVETFIHINGED